MEELEPHLDSLLDCLHKILHTYGYNSSVMYATSYALENVAAHPVGCKHLLKPEHSRTEDLLDFIVVNARGETEANNSPIMKYVIAPVLIITPVCIFPRSVVRNMPPASLSPHMWPETPRHRTAP